MGSYLGRGEPVAHGGVAVLIRERRRELLLAAILLLTALGSALASIRRPIMFDELFTFFVSARPSVSELLRALLDGADNHPPLDYLARHLSMSLLGESTFAFRLPSLLAVIGGCLAIYGFVLKRASFAAAIAAVGFAVCTEAVFYSFVGRPYALLFLTAAASLYAWQRVTANPRDAAGIALLVVSLACAPLAHYYGVLNYLPIAVGELVRMLRDRRIHIPVAACMLVSLLAMPLLVPFMLNASAFSESFWTSLRPSAPFRVYFQLLTVFGLTILICSAAVALLSRGPRFDRQSWSDVRGWPMHELAATTVLCLVPFFVYAIAVVVTGAQTARYSIGSLAGLAILVGFTTALIERRNWLAAAAILTITLVGGLLALAKMVDDAEERPINARLTAFVDEAQLPIVVSNPKPFLTLYYELGAQQRQKLVYLADREAAIRFRGFDSDDLALMNLSRTVPIGVAELSEFLTSHDRFLLLHGRNGWLPSMLAEQGATLALEEDFGTLGIAFCVHRKGGVQDGC